MLAIRLQRQGRSNHAHYRMIVQDSRWHPTNNKIIAQLGTYDPHTKASRIDAERAKQFLGDGAQPSTRAAYLLKAAGVKLPKWVVITKQAKRTVRNPEKLRKNRPKNAPVPAAKAPEPLEGKVEESPAEAEMPPAEVADTAAAEVETPAEAPAEAPVEAAEDTPAETEEKS